jgi:hypothetical protein
MSLLDMIPGVSTLRSIGIAVAFGALTAGVSGLVYYNRGETAGEATVQKVLDKAVFEANKAADKASNDYRSRELELTQKLRSHEDEAATKLTALRADIVARDAAAGRLQQRVAALVAASRQAAAGSAPVQSRPSTDDPIGVLADVLSRADARAGLLATVADERGIAGKLCEREYDDTRETLNKETP